MTDTERVTFQRDLNLVRHHLKLADYLGPRQPGAGHHCPFCHQDSLEPGYINPDRYFCRSCHRTGDVVDIIRQQENLTESKENTAAVLALRIRMDKALTRLMTEDQQSGGGIKGSP